VSDLGATTGPTADRGQQSYILQETANSGCRFLELFSGTPGQRQLMVFVLERCSDESHRAINRPRIVKEFETGIEGETHEESIDKLLHHVRERMGSEIGDDYILSFVTGKIV